MDHVITVVLDDDLAAGSVDIGRWRPRNVHVVQARPTACQTGGKLAVTEIGARSDNGIVRVDARCIRIDEGL